MKKIILVLLMIFAIVGVVLWSVGIGARKSEKNPKLSATPIQILPPDPRPNIVVINLDAVSYTHLTLPTIYSV